MRFEDLDFQPSTRKLRQFALIAAILLLVATALRYRASHELAWLPLAAAIVFAAAGVFAPSAVRLVWIASSVVTFPIGWLVSRLALVLFYFAVITPLAALLRLFRKSPHQDGFERGTETYWTRVTLPEEPRRYFDQF
jgi:hypothetical protein